MSEPEEVIIEGAHLTTTYAAALWRRNVPGRPPLPGLSDVRTRLEFYVAALCPDAPAIVVAEPPAVPHLLARLMKRIPPHLVRRAAHCSTDGRRIRLPRALDRDTERETLELYRLLALEQALRATRGSPLHVPGDDEPLLRDLYLLSEAAAVDRELVAMVPGLRPLLVRQRAEARRARPAPDVLTGPERALERWLLAVLDAPPERPPEPMLPAPTPAGSLAWARARAATLVDGEERYRGLPAVALWGRIHAPPSRQEIEGHVDDDAEPAPPAPDRTRTMERRPDVREPSEEEDDDGDGMWMLPIDDREEKAEDPMGLTRPVDRDDAFDLDELAESLEELPEARLVRTTGSPREVLASEDPPPAPAALLDASSGGIGITYPEWDYRTGCYRPDHVTVRLGAPPLASGERADELARESARLVAAVRRRFERLQPRRVRLGRQSDGEDVDLDAYVVSVADMRAGGAVEDRLYETHRPLRRELAIALLVDVSGSTDSWVSGRRRIIDVEREALLVVCEALDALGDRYAVLGFSGAGPGAVRVLPVKDYAERYSRTTRRRIAALEPDRYTRLGAAIRHAVTGLARESARHRLLLVLSDGKPNDLDEYEGRYGVEDARQAVAEARLQQMHSFCLTVDREAPAYMPRIFGPTDFSTLRRPERLPHVLVDVVRRLIAA